MSVAELAEYVEAERQEEAKKTAKRQKALKQAREEAAEALRLTAQRELLLAGELSTRARREALARVLYGLSGVSLSNLARHGFDRAKVDHSYVQHVGVHGFPQVALLCGGSHGGRGRLSKDEYSAREALFTLLEEAP